MSVFAKTKFNLNQILTLDPVYLFCAYGRLCLDGVVKVFFILLLYWYLILFVESVKLSIVYFRYYQICVQHNDLTDENELANLC